MTRPSCCLINTLQIISLINDKTFIRTTQKSNSHGYAPVPLNRMKPEVPGHNRIVEVVDVLSVPVLVSSENLFL